MQIVDLSNNNDVYSFALLRARGIRGVFLKVSEGDTYIDHTFQDYRRRAKRAGLFVGGYHFARPRGGNALRQAQLFAHLYGQLGRRDLRPLLDFEDRNSGLTHTELVQWARDFNHAIAGVMGVWPLLYADKAYVDALRATHTIGAGLVLAWYGPNDGKRHPGPVPAPWRMYVAQQYTSRGRLLGVRGYVDRIYAPRLTPLRARR